MFFVNLPWQSGVDWIWISTWISSGNSSTSAPVELCGVLVVPSWNKPSVFIGVWGPREGFLLLCVPAAVHMLSGRPGPTSSRLLLPTPHAWSSLKANLLRLLSALKGRVIHPSTPRHFCVGLRVVTFLRWVSPFSDPHSCRTLFTSVALRHHSQSLSSSTSSHPPWTT